jgi:hypothetical protein
MPLFKRVTKISKVESAKNEQPKEQVQSPVPVPLPLLSTGVLTEDEEKLLAEWREKWSETLRSNFALGVVGHTVGVPHQGEILLFYNLQTISEKREGNVVEKHFIGLAEDLSLKEVYVKYAATPQGISIDSEVKPADRRKLKLDVEAVAKIIHQVIKYEVT